MPPRRPPRADEPGKVALNTASPSARPSRVGTGWFSFRGRMSTAYTKPHLALPDQVALLQSRGLVVPDASQAEQWLSVVDYYRLTGYWYPYRVQRTDGPGREDRFADGTTFDQVVALYDLDRRLKLLIIDALERIEIAMRFRVGHTLGRYGPYAHLDRANLDTRFPPPAVAPTPAGTTSGCRRPQRRRTGRGRTSSSTSAAPTTGGSRCGW